MNYEEKYKQALERAKKLQKTCDSTAVVGWCEYIFPELKESEPESIREDLIEWFKEFPDMIWRGHYKNDVLAWLEKQKEKQSIWTDNDRVMAFTLLRDVDQMTYISTEGKNERLQWLNSLEDKFNNVE